ncbi:SDR family oxidoreductase [Kribbella sandramycini]|uniref:Nucleoside-diphosphate-sugar epimerase n=1 Tax=Kribbella sandramycini TaxID=60450 RepID=A0A841SAJ6_9ACTN|nr:nucleoside-diphosphate-sugar epimerase [Kribbella sandramycini]
MRELLFRGKFADVEALSRGDADAVRSVLGASLRHRLSRLPCREHRVALVFGGNGFVGAHLVARLSREPGIEQVWVAGRAMGEGGVEQRFDKTVARYAVSGAERSKIRWVEATPTRVRFGLTEAAYGELAGEVDLVFNCASSSDYSASYLELRDDWVLSLLRVLQFATEGRRKHLTYMGSLSSYFYQQPEDFRRPDSWWYSGYAQMKWVNGRILQHLSSELPLTLCESPYVLGATDVGLDPGLTYSWWRVIEIARSLGLIWDGPGMGYVPVDVLVDCLVVNALQAMPQSRLLPRNPVPYRNGLLAELLDAELVSWEEFLAEAERRIPVRRIGSALSENPNRLVEIVNEPSVVMPEVCWSPELDNRRLLELYLSKVPFRNIARPAELSA